MKNENKWMKNQYRAGMGFLIAGIFTAAAGALLRMWISTDVFNLRIITGVGILLLGIGFSFLFRYWSARREPAMGMRMANEAADERNRLLRARAGNRAYWVSTAMAYGGLMWSSFAASGSLPPMTDDAVWFLLAAVVMVPFGVYAAGLAWEQNRE